MLIVASLTRDLALHSLTMGDLGNVGVTVRAGQHAMGAVEEISRRVVDTRGVSTWFPVRHVLVTHQTVVVVSESWSAWGRQQKAHYQ